MAEISLLWGTLSCIVKHQSVDLRKVVGYEWMYRGYDET